MEAAWKGRIAGIFEGYREGGVHELSGGSRWGRRIGRTNTSTASVPGPRLLRDKGTELTHLDVEDTSRLVQVVRDRGMSG